MSNRLRRTRRVDVFACFCFGGALVFSTTSSSATGVQEDSPTTGGLAQDIPAMILDRQRLGLASDEPSVLAAIADPRKVANGYSQYPITLEESAVLDRRWGVYAPLLGKIGESYQDRESFAGVWMDAVSDTAVLGVSGPDGESLRTAIGQKLPADVSLEIKIVKYSHRELIEAKDALQNEVRARHAITAVLYLPDNRVTVTVESSEDATYISAKYGDIVHTRIGKPIQTRDTVNDNTLPLRGGKQILQNGYACTATWVGAGSNGYYQVTAGHCSNNRVAWRYGGGFTGSGPTRAFGSMFNSRWYLPPQPSGFVEVDCDCGAIGPFGTDIASSTYYYELANRPTLPNGTASESMIVTNLPVCSSGSYRGFRCGNVTDPASNVHEFTNPPHYYHSQIWTTVQTCGGDSGSPLVSGGRLFGVASGGPNDCGDTFYSKAHLVAARLGVGPVYTEP